MEFKGFLGDPLFHWSEIHCKYIKINSKYIFIGLKYLNNNNRSYMIFFSALDGF